MVGSGETSGLNAVVETLVRGVELLVVDAVLLGLGARRMASQAVVGSYQRVRQLVERRSGRAADRRDREYGEGDSCSLPIRHDLQLIVRSTPASTPRGIDFPARLSFASSQADL